MGKRDIRAPRGSGGGATKVLRQEISWAGLQQRANSASELNAEKRFGGGGGKKEHQKKKVDSQTGSRSHTVYFRRA